MTNRLIVNIFLLTLITITCYSQQAESVVTEDLSLLYLNWKFKHNRDSSSVNNLQTVHGTPAFFTATIDNTSTIRESCDAFIYEFAKQASQFIECSIDNARPFRFCEGCVVHYMKAKTVYNDIKVVCIIYVQTFSSCIHVSQNSNTFHFNKWTYPEGGGVKIALGIWVNMLYIGCPVYHLNPL